MGESDYYQITATRNTIQAVLVVIYRKFAALLPLAFDIRWRQIGNESIIAGYFS